MSRSLTTECTLTDQDEIPGCNAMEEEEEEELCSCIFIPPLRVHGVDGDKFAFMETYTAGCSTCPTQLKLSETLTNLALK